MKALRGVHAVFTSPDDRNPDASFDDVHYEVLAEGEPAGRTPVIGPTPNRVRSQLGVP